MAENQNKDLEAINKIATLVNEAGGQTYFVGGCVRDALLGVECKDFDVEVYGVEPSKLEAILDEVGTRIEIGKSFSVYALKGYSVDVALPRREYAVGVGHKDFVVTPDPFISTIEACLRRDFTINAMMRNVLSGEIVDHFGGRNDLTCGILRHVNDHSFVEDPLRVFRLAQFSARFGFSIDEKTADLCSKMKVDALPKERVFEELSKALLKAEKPSVFFEVLRKINLLDEFFPEIKALIGVEQSKKHHLEGEVWTHTMMVLDEAAKLKSQTSNPLAFMLSALSHDLGKPACTTFEKGDFHAYNHEIIGLPTVETFLKRIASDKTIIKYVLNMTKLHMRPNVLAGLNSSIKATNKLFDSAVCPQDLIYLAVSDGLGKLSDYPYVDTLPFLTERLEIYKDYTSRPEVTGKDLVEAGLKPDKNFSEILSYAHKLHLAGVEKSSALKQTLAYAKKFIKK